MEKTDGITGTAVMGSGHTAAILTFDCPAQLVRHMSNLVNRVGLIYIVLLQCNNIKDGCETAKSSNINSGPFQYITKYCSLLQNV